MVGTIGHPLGSPLHLMEANIAPSSHQEPSLCSASDEKEKKNVPLFFFLEELRFLLIQLQLFAAAGQMFMTLLTLQAVKPLTSV